MFTRRREKRRFQLDVPHPSQRGGAQGLQGSYVTVKLPSVSRRKKRRFQIGPRGVSRWRSRWLALTPQATLGHVSAWRRALTLGERRRFRRLGMIAGAVVVVVALIASALLLNPQTREALIPSSAPAASVAGASSAVGLAHGAFQQPLHEGAELVFSNLRPYISTGGAQSPDVQASAAFLFDPQRGVILYQKNADTSYPAASLTKVMTLLVAIDSPQLDQETTIGPDAAALVNSDNSYMDVSVGEKLTVRELLYGLIVQGGNDAAIAIADAVGGDEPSFVAMMNARARQLGLMHTHFVSADGLDDGNVTSASDMAKLSALAVMRPGVTAITSAYTYVIPQTPTHKLFTLQSENDLLQGGAAPYPGANGIKTGYTAAAQYCMAFSVVSNGRLLVGVALGEPTVQARTADVHALLDWGFAQQ